MPSQPPDQLANRATPLCPHFGPCGGCQLQHLTYPAQLVLKAEKLHALLTPTGLSHPEIQLHPSPPLVYRNRIRLTLTQVDGEFRAGYVRNLQAGPESAGLSILPITQCPIAAPILWRATEAFLALINADAPTWRSPNHIPDQLELFTTADESALNVTLYLRTGAGTAAKTLPIKLNAAFTTLCEALRTRIPELTGAGISILPRVSTERSRRIEVPRPGPTWGAQGLLYNVAIPNASADSYWVPRGGFFQVNRFLIEALAQIVTSSRAGKLAWDLYAGVGLFSRPLARTFTQVTAVEIAEPAFTALAAGSKAGKLPNLHAVKATTLDFLRAAVLQRDRPDLIVLDPPRSGAGPDVCGLLARIAAPTLIYVSCSPQTLPADLITLSSSGYAVTQLHLLDLFPQTTHIETVAILTR
jgi:23S rRNA (uracil1939-C5)-methyltransferase